MMYFNGEPIANASVDIGTVPTVNPNWDAKEGEPGYIENRTHYKSNGLYTTLDPNYLPDTVRADKLEERLTSIIDERIAQSGSGGSGGGSGGGLSYEEFNVYVPGGDVRNAVLKCKKWNYGLLEIEGTCTFTPAFCDEMESLYTCGSLMLYFRLGNSSTADPVPFIKAPTFTHFAPNMVGMFANSSPLFADEAHMMINIYSIIPGNTFDVPVNIYVRGYWK